MFCIIGTEPLQLLLRCCWCVTSWHLVYELCIAVHCSGAAKSEYLTKLCSKTTKFGTDVHTYGTNIFRYWATENLISVSAILDFKMAVAANRKLAIFTLVLTVDILRRLILYCRIIIITVYSFCFNNNSSAAAAITGSHRHHWYIGWSLSLSTWC